MSKKNCSFNDDWLKDPRFSKWIARDKSLLKARCTICYYSFNLSNMGIGAVISHSSGKKHLNKSQSVKQAVTLFQATITSICRSRYCTSCEVEKVAYIKSKQTDEPTSSKKTIESYIVPASTLNVEILWALKVVMSHYSLRSSVGLSELFKAMFSDIAKGFALSRTKCTYLINFGISPYFKSRLLKDIQFSPYFVVSYDESVNRILQDEQMDIQIRYWNETFGLVDTRYFDSKFLKRPNAVNLTAELNAALTELPIKHMTQLSMDGHNTNWKVLEIFEKVNAKSLLYFTLGSLIVEALLLIAAFSLIIRFI